MKSTRKALIVGCGIAGPVLAVALRRVGIAATIVEADPVPRDDAGAFLGLAPNGLNVLKMLGLLAPVHDAGFPMRGMAFFNQHGRRIGTIDFDGQQRRYGAGSLMIRRGGLQRVLRQAAQAEGVPIQFGRRLVGLDDDGAQVVARFADGSTAAADLLIGCDGIGSRTRQLAFPAAPPPAYTGLVGSGGIARAAGAPSTHGLMHMTFGRRAFFGHITAPDGTTLWFDNVSDARGADRQALDAADDMAWQAQLLDTHRGDPAPIGAILGTATSGVVRVSIFDLPSLPAWRRGRVCLLGDAAHATSPHAGQGASLAMEDALVLAACLHTSSDPAVALARYEAIRRGRVERLVQQARRNGDRKVPSSTLGRAVRDLLMPLFLRLGSHAMHATYDWRIEHEGLVWPAGAGAKTLASAA